MKMKHYAVRDDEQHSSHIERFEKPAAKCNLLSFLQVMGIDWI